MIKDDPLLKEIDDTVKQPEILGQPQIYNTPPENTDEIKYFIERKNLEIQMAKEKKSNKLDLKDSKEQNEVPDYLKNILPKPSKIQNINVIMISLLKKKNLKKIVFPDLNSH